MNKPSRLNAGDSSVADSPGRFTSALNTHTSVLNTADYVDNSPPQGHAFGSDESRCEAQDSRDQVYSSEDDSSGRSSGSGIESDSGSVSSSDDEREEHQGGGKTLPGIITTVYWRVWLIFPVKSIKLSRSYCYCFIFRG